MLTDWAEQVPLVGLIRAQVRKGRELPFADQMSSRPNVDEIATPYVEAADHKSVRHQQVVNRKAQDEARAQYPRQPPRSWRQGGCFRAIGGRHTLHPAELTVVWLTARKTLHLLCRSARFWNSPPPDHARPANLGVQLLLTTP